MLKCGGPTSGSLVGVAVVSSRSFKTSVVLVVEGDNVVGSGAVDDEGTIIGGSVNSSGCGAGISWQKLSEITHSQMTQGNLLKIILPINTDLNLKQALQQ